MEFRSVSIPLQQRVFYHFRDVWSRCGEPYAELGVIRSLPSDMRKAVLSEVRRRGAAIGSQHFSCREIIRARAELELRHCGERLRFN